MASKSKPVAPADELGPMNERAVADYYGVSVASVRKWRRHGGGPKFVHLGSRVIYTRRWCDEHLIEQLKPTPKARTRRKAAALTTTAA